MEQHHESTVFGDDEEAAEDIEERARRTAAELNDTKALLRVLIENSPQEISLFDASGTVVFTTPAGLRLHGFSSIDEFRMSLDRLEEVLEARTPDGRLLSVSEWPLVRALRGEAVRDFQLELHNRLTGRTWTGLLHATPVFDEQGRITSVILFNQDITPIKKAELALREANAANQRYLAQIRALVDQMTEGVVTFDPDGRVLDANLAALAVNGFPDVPTLRERFARLEENFDLFDMEGAPLPVADWPVTRVLRGETFDSQVVRIHRRDNGRSWIASYGGSPVYDPDGRLMLSFITVRDVTEQRRMEEALRESEDLFRDAFDLAPMGMVLTDLDGRFQRVNPAYCRITGYSREELLDAGMSFQALTHPADLDENVSEVDRVVTGQAPAISLEKRYLRKDGSIIWVEASASLRRDAAGRPVQIIGLVQDINARKLAEEALRQLNETLEQRVIERTELAEQRAKRLQELASEVTLSEQRERRRLAHVLHDDLQQLLVAARFNCEILFSSVDAERRHIADNVTELINTSIQVSRSLSAELSPPALRLGGLSTGLQWLADWMRENHGLEVDVAAPEELNPEREDITEFLFQSVRELLLNVVKHAGVRAARVTVTRDGDGFLRVVVSDQGAGFDSDLQWQEEEPGAGLGLFTIRDRLTLLGGRMELESSPGMGATLSLVVPPGSQKEDA